MEVTLRRVTTMKTDSVAFEPRSRLSTELILACWFFNSRKSLPPKLGLRTFGFQYHILLHKYKNMSDFDLLENDLTFFAYVNQLKSDLHIFLEDRFWRNYFFQIWQGQVARMGWHRQDKCCQRIGSLWWGLVLHQVGFHGQTHLCQVTRRCFHSLQNLWR